MVLTVVRAKSSCKGYACEALQWSSFHLAFYARAIHIIVLLPILRLLSGPLLFAVRLERARRHLRPSGDVLSDSARPCSLSRLGAGRTRNAQTAGGRHLTQYMRVGERVEGRPTIFWMLSVARTQGLAVIARHVIGCRVTQEARVENACR
jgi:hypothetical protein